jgi:hypothetical protein
MGQSYIGPSNATATQYVARELSSRQNGRKSVGKGRTRDRVREGVEGGREGTGFNRRI